MRKRIALFVLTIAVSPLMAQEPDAEGCKDSPLLSRMRGCVIDRCDKKEFDEAEVLVGVSDEGEKKKALEGEVDVITYRCPNTLSRLMIARNAENALKQAGFTSVFSGKTDNGPAVTLRKGGVWVDIQTSPDSNELATWYTQIVVRSKEMEQQMVASAEAMEADIAKSGYCSIYGVHFDTGKAVILPDSEQCLNEVAKLLKKNATWKMQVEGHTDNVGAKEANLKLSQARAGAVRGWLVSHGVDGARLVAKGFGDAKPVSDNTSDEGRSKNRRVDLRKI